MKGLTLAVTDMSAMTRFYSDVFGIEFQSTKVGGFELYRGEWLGIDLLFCPAALARNNATQNRHQFDIVVQDLAETKTKIEKAGGIVFDATETSLSVYDPDRNSIVFSL